MTNTLKDSTMGQPGQTQGQVTGIGTGSGVIIPTDVGLRAQALEYALKHNNNNDAQATIKSAELYYQFLRTGLEQTIATVTNGQQAQRYPAGQSLGQPAQRG